MKRGPHGGASTSPKLVASGVSGMAVLCFIAVDARRFAVSARRRELLELRGVPTRFS
ncbi:hypothetical protein BCAR13_1800014 [Paraburkholderia caribensis]|nr:hypothetical protein BCAR13_1800014 [Paraburkholderia caribensis]